MHTFYMVGDSIQRNLIAELLIEFEMTIRDTLVEKGNFFGGRFIISHLHI